MIRKLWVAAVLAVAFVPLASAARDQAICSASPSSAAVGEPVTFSAENVQDGATSVEIIGGTVPFDAYFDVGHVESYSFQWTFEQAGTYTAVFYKDIDSSSIVYRIKCDAWVEVE